MTVVTAESPELSSCEITPLSAPVTLAIGELSGEEALASRNPAARRVNSRNGGPTGYKRPTKPADCAVAATACLLLD